MPNHITNIVSIAGKRSLKGLLGERGYLDLDDEDRIVFNRVIPMPDAVGFRGENLPCNPEPESKWGKVYAHNLKKYGFQNWYDWSRVKWGTKWDCYEFSWVTDKKCTFLTAWSPPDPILQTLADTTGRRIRNRWMDEGDGKWHTDIYEPSMLEEPVYSVLVNRKLEVVK